MMDCADRVLSNNVESFRWLVIDNGSSLHDITDILTFFEEIIVEDIIVIGDCALLNDQAALEYSIDDFLRSNRVWSYLYESNDAFNQRCQSSSSSSSSSGILVHLRKTKPGKKSQFYKHIELYQYPFEASRRRIVIGNHTSKSMSRSRSDTCRHGRMLIHELGPRGMFATLHMLAYAMSRSFEWHRTLLIDDHEFAYITNNWTDLFLPISSCTLNDIDHVSKNNRQVVNHLLEQHYNDSNQVAVVTKDYLVYARFITSYRYPNDWFDSAQAYRSYLMDWLLRPSAPTRLYIAKSRLFLWGGKPPSTCIAMQIRNGDKANETGVPPPTLGQYMDVLQEFTLNGTRYLDVFVMTDNDTVVEELRRTQLHQPYRFHFLPNVHRSDADIAAQLSNTRQKDIAATPPHVMGMEVLAEVLLASECNLFIGTLSSNVGRAIIELMRAKNHDPSLKSIFWRSVDNSTWVANP
ncbi:hypothetical protein SAMD00019534_103110 [Acytostelium subglobosum LB1]|uniref:hypothetical protein n=1 Tax=Acytostelium subglobosum LB1 TaxID=1410327 RepID=UPI000644A981|nr:hypothetical protein SAMD00019534_103110 [Acytostelium subglobosum LB1]GAM27136.1 hypothetical protein SAMD00019534_103110 [Acytostelium subglobosum LB1]|eukprot:XP_012750016.1 hypothetical protein SAMD00019534_103110 [Acytostelium subglobosum LB1]